MAFMPPFAYVNEVKPWTNLVLAFHAIPVNTGLHWPKGGECWCHPTSQFGYQDDLPTNKIVWIHKPYKPNWGS